MRVVTAAAVVLLLAAWGTQSAQGPVTSAPRTAGPPPTDSAQTPSPTAAAVPSQLNRDKPVTATHGLPLYEDVRANVLGVLDVADPLHPTLLYELLRPGGAPFVHAASETVFFLCH